MLFPPRYEIAIAIKNLEAVITPIYYKDVVGRVYRDSRWGSKLLIIGTRRSSSPKQVSIAIKLLWVIIATVDD
jgi:hypothetical protein